MCYVPKEFQQLSENAAESRKRTELLYSSAVSSKPMPFRVIVGGRQHGESTVSVLENIAVTHEVNGSSGLPSPQSDVTSEMSSAHSDVMNVMPPRPLSASASHSSAQTLTNGKVSSAHLCLNISFTYGLFKSIHKV